MTEYLFYGGPILTMEDPAHTPEALTVRDGKILAVGSFCDLRSQSPRAWLINLKGRALLPAFIDSHGHFVQYAGTLRHADLTGCASFEQLAQRLKNFIRQNGVQPGQAVVGLGYDPEQLAQGRHPDKALLDEVSRAHPILITHADGHMGVLNSLALATLGLPEKASDLPSGLYGRDEEGRLTGFVQGEAFLALRRGLAAPPRGEEALELLRQAQEIYFSQGFTTAQEGFARSYEAGLLRRAADEGVLQLDVVGYADIRDHADLLPRDPARRGYQNHFRMGGYKLFLDGSPQDRAAWTEEEYADQPGYRGYPLLSDQEVAEYLALADARGAQLLCRCSGDRAAAQFLAARQKPSRCRDVLIHAQLLRPDQMPALKKAGVMPSFFAAYPYHWGDTCLKYFGPARTAALCPAASARAAGLPYTFQMDSPVLPPNALDMLWCACNRRTRRGLNLAQGEELGVWDALLGLTRYGAWQYGEESEKGTLAPGKKADLVILSADPRTLPREGLRRLTVEATFKEGLPVYRKPED